MLIRESHRRLRRCGARFRAGHLRFKQRSMHETQASMIPSRAEVALIIDDEIQIRRAIVNALRPFTSRVLESRRLYPSRYRPVKTPDEWTCVRTEVIGKRCRHIYLEI